MHRREPVIEDRSIDYVRCDLTRPEDCKRAVAGMQYVYLCAASTSGAAAINATPMIHVTPNVLINSLMLEAAYEAEVEKLLWLGSTVAYPVSDKPMREELPHHAILKIFSMRAAIELERSALERAHLCATSGT